MRRLSMKLPRPLKPKVAEAIRKQLGISEAHLEAATSEIILVPKVSEKEGFVVNGAFLLLIPVRGHLEQMMVTRDDLVDEEGGK